MTKKELQEELIHRIKQNEEKIEKCNNYKDQRKYSEGRKSGLIYALQLLEYLDEGKA